MSAEKTVSVILSVSPYRETSCILRLFTNTRGLVHGIAKGVRGGGKSSVPVDRGFLLEANLYYRPNRELHTLGSLHVTGFFPGIRSDIIKSSIRDIALELYLKSITQSEPHPELFELLVKFLGGMDGPAASRNLYPLLWRFIYRYCRFMGFGIDRENSNVRGIDTAVIKSIDRADDADGPDGAGNAPPSNRSNGENLRITELLLQYCRQHLDIRTHFNALDFLRSLY
ncbi:MAG: DNA repair protein RecO [Chitinispirillia bacterium]|nr:DNA repair protein RecO [Chitinispirillia bacterium]